MTGIIDLLVLRVLNGKMTLDDVPADLREDVENKLKGFPVQQATNEGTSE